MSKNLDLMVIYPNNRIRAYGAMGPEIAAITPPLQAGLIAGYARKHNLEVNILDAEVQNLDAKDTARQVIQMNPKLVCLCTDYLNSGDVTKIESACETLQAIKRLSSTQLVLMEGVVPSAFPEKMLQEGADYVCQGEAFDPIVQLIEHLKKHPMEAPFDPDSIRGVWTLHNGKVISNRRAQLIKKPDLLAFVAWDLMPPTQYRAHHWHCFDSLEHRTPYASIYTNLGCPYDCTFCNVNVVAGKPSYRPRTPDNVIEEIDLLVKKYGVRNIRILDNVFTTRLDLVEQLCDLIIAKGYDLNMWAYARVETIRNPEIMKKMKKAGVNWLAYGIEAASEKVRRMSEKPSSQKVIDQAIEWTQEAGIYIVGNFIFGLPEDDQESIQKSLDMAKEYNFEWTNFYSAMAYPGTKLHAEALKGNIPLPKTWSGYGQYSSDALPLATKYLTPAEILKFRDAAFLEYYTNPKYLKMMGEKFGIETVNYIKGILQLGSPHRNVHVA